MLSISYSKLLKLLSAVLLAMVFTIGFTKNVSYAMTFDEFFYYVQEHYNTEYDNLSYDLKSYLGKWLTYANKNTMRSYWQDNNAIIMDFGLTPNSNSKTVHLYFINNNNNLTFGRTITGVGSFKRMGFDVYNSKNQVNIYSASSYNGNISLSSTTTFVSNTKTNRNAFIVQEKQKQSATNEYWFTDILTRYNFVFLDNYINYNNQYKTIGYLDGQDLNTHKFEAILYSDYGTNSEIVVGRVNPYQNVEYNMNIPMYDNNHIYISVLSRLLIPNKEYYIRVLYDNDYDFEDNIYFTFQTDVSGNIINGDYTIQNSTNDIIQNQNKNTNDIVNAIESGDKNITDILTAPIDLSGENIGSGEIIGALDINFSGDPFENIWTSIIDGFRTSLLGSVRSTTVEFNGNTYTINIDDMTNALPPALKVFLATASTFYVVWALIKWTKNLINNISSGNVDTILQQNKTEGIINLF